jgi:hypothetical protein
LKLKCDFLVSKFAFKRVNLYRYIAGADVFSRRTLADMSELIDEATITTGGGDDTIDPYADGVHRVHYGQTVRGGGGGFTDVFGKLGGYCG